MMRFRSLVNHLFRAQFSTSKPESLTEVYTYPYNVNKEQNKPYLQQVERQLNSALTAEVNPIPRRKRRLYDRPKYDQNIQHYGAWRLFGNQRMVILGEESVPMAFKIMLVPKDVQHTFGVHHLPDYFF